MAAGRNNDNYLFDPGDRNDMGSFREWDEEGRKSIWSHVSRLFSGNTRDDDIFQKHAESVRRFRKSHFPNQGIGATGRGRVPMLCIDTTASETGGSTGPVKAIDWLFLLPECEPSPHQFSPN